jgi:hypothetical protein
MVAESCGWLVFFDYRKDQVANLLEYGGVYADLHADLTERSKKGNELNAQWVRDNLQQDLKASKL